MPRKKRKRQNVGGFQHSNNEILDGKAKIVSVPNNGVIGQFQMWISEEKKCLWKALKTKDFETTVKRAEGMYLNAYSNVVSSRKLFGIILKEPTERFVEWREEDVSLGHRACRSFHPNSGRYFVCHRRFLHASC